MDFLGDPSLSSAVEVVTFVREVIETYPDLRESILQKLLSSFKLITSSTVSPSSLLSSPHPLALRFLAVI